MATMKRLLFSMLAALTLAAAQPGSAAELPTTKLTIGKHTLTAELAVSYEEQRTGLMNRFSLKPDHGMLFIYGQPQPLAFYMRNTYVALSIAFIGADGRIVDIQDMLPQTEDTHWSRVPAMYALEMKRGWFAERGIVAGDLVKGLPTATGKR
jgi:uncharacterized membrane protein (UPF0127 family)